MFNDRRVITALLGIWTLICAITFYVIMAVDNSPFLSFGPNEHTRLFGVALDTWPKWWCVAIYTFLSTAIAAFASDSVSPFILNTIQDHKTVYIPYSKWICLMIIQVYTCYAVVVTIIGLFVALTQIDFTLIRLASDLLVNHVTTAYFLRGKVVDRDKYDAWVRQAETGNIDSELDDDFMDIELQIQKDKTNPNSDKSNDDFHASGYTDTTPLKDDNSRT
jgi:hypothetical protein